MFEDVKTLAKNYRSPLIHKSLVIAGSIIGALAVHAFNKQEPELHEVLVLVDVDEEAEPAEDTVEPAGSTAL